MGTLQNPRDVAGSNPDQPKCECCGKALHESQVGAEIVSEEEWYDLNETIPDDPAAPPVQNKRGFAEWQRTCTDLKNRKQALNNRRRRVAASKNCPSYPQPPCNVYRKITADQTKAAEREWDLASPEYKDRMKVPLVRSTKKDRHGKKIPQRATVHHKVPKSAGGCPTGDGNLVSDHMMSRACSENDAELGAVQSQCAQRWAEAVA